MYPNHPKRSSTLLPKTHRNSMLPSTCSHEPCRNMEYRTPSHTFLCGNTSRCPPGRSQLRAFTSQYVSGEPCSSSCGITACSYVNLVLARSDRGCTTAKMTMHAAMISNV